MDYTYLDYFNYYLKEFLNELVSNYPETQTNILSNYRSLLEGRDDKNDIYVKCYYTKINNYLGQIAKKDETMFATSNLIFIEGVDFCKVWNSSSTTDINRKAIWKYLQILMIIGRKTIPNHKEIIEILNKISNGEIVAPAKVERTLATDTTDDDEKPSSVFGLGDIASSLGSLGSLAGGGAGGLGGLVSGLTGLLGGGGENGGGLGNLMSSFTEMFSNPDFTNAMNQLSQQMSFNAPTDNTESSTNDVETDDTLDTNTTENLTDDQTASDTVSSQQESSQKESSQQESSQPTIPPIFNNPLFSDLAKEITSTFNLDEMNQGGQPASIGEALGKFMSGNNPAKLLNLVGKFGSKLQNEVKNGNLNPAELLSQTMSAAGGSIPENLQQAAANMMNNPQVKNQMARMSQQQATRDRLKAKLAKKQAETRDEMSQNKK